MAAGSTGGATYVFATRSAFTGSSSFAIYATNGAKVVADSRSIVNSGIVYAAVGGNIFVRNNSVLGYTTPGTTPGTYTGEIR